MVGIRLVATWSASCDQDELFTVDLAKAGQTLASLLGVTSLTTQDQAAGLGVLGHELKEGTAVSDAFWVKIGGCAGVAGGGHDLSECV